MALFLKIVGKIQYEEMVDANPDMAPAILFPFAIVFFFILLNMFVAIVMSNYSVLRKSSQKKTEANARIAEEEGKNWSNRLMNLVFCVHPKTKDQKDSDKEEEYGNAASKNIFANIVKMLSMLLSPRVKKKKKLTPIN